MPAHSKAQKDRSDRRTVPAVMEHKGTVLCVDGSAISVLKSVRVIRNAGRSGIKGLVNC